jgi:hypothetical protein
VPGYQPDPAYGNPYNYPTEPPASPPQQTIALGAPPMSGPPMSGAPYAGPPMSGPPMSGPPYGGPPMSGAPYSGAPAYGAQPGMQPPPRARRGVAVPILASLAALLLIAASVLTVLYVNKSGDLAAAKKTISARDTSIADKEKEITQLKADLQTKSDALDSAQRDLRGTQNDNEKNKKDKETVSLCLRLLLDALAAANRNDSATFNKKLTDMKKPCDEAEKIMA